MRPYLLGALVVLALVCLFRFQDGARVTSAQGGGAGGGGVDGNGDVNGDGSRDISDASYLLNWLFLGGPPPVACAGGVDTELPRLRISNPAGDSTLFFGPTDDCSIGVEPRLPGLTERDPTGFRLLGQDVQGCRLIFGPTMDCTVEVDPGGPAGLLLRDPSGIRIVPRDLVSPPQLLFGPTDDCSIGVFPELPGLTESDPIGFRLLGRGGEGCRLIFGPTMDCTVEIQPQGPSGLLLRDPRAIRIVSPDPDGPNCLFFGPTDECRIVSRPGDNNGLVFTDPRGFRFEGVVFAQEFVPLSTRRVKENVRPIENALETIQKLQGVEFEWNEEHGGKKSIGFVAEDVGEVLPEVVVWEEDGVHAKGMSYDKIVPLAIEGVKEQQTQIESLRKENVELKSQLSSLEAQVARLAERLAALDAVR